VCRSTNVLQSVIWAMCRHVICIDSPLHYCRVVAFVVIFSSYTSREASAKTCRNGPVVSFGRADGRGAQEHCRTKAFRYNAVGVSCCHSIQRGRLVEACTVSAREVAEHRRASEKREIHLDPCRWQRNAVCLQSNGLRGHFDSVK